MMRTGIRRATVVAAIAVCAWGASGCSDDAETSPDDDAAHSIDEVAASWGEISPRDEERTRSYLDGGGRQLMEYADYAVTLHERLDDVAYADRCADLRAEWDEAYAGRRMVDRLHGLSDPILGRLWTSQLTSIETALGECADGDQEASTATVGHVAEVQELVDRRLDQLGVDR